MSRKPWKKGHNDASGSVPEHGAIFMSSRSTRKECLRRRIFGLPSGQAAFVKQIRRGMVLFLFEYESRELHGVFQAKSDGGMNIIPHAYSSTGKQYPAQVEFSRMWRCRPLCEEEFGDAIEENYFTSKKFNFGLTKIQVKRLLALFSMKRVDKRFSEGKSNDPGLAVKDNRLQASSSRKSKGIAGGDVDYPSTYPFASRRAYANDGRSIDDRGIENETNLGRISMSPTKNEYSRHYSSNFERECDTSGLGMINRTETDFDMDANFRTDGSTISPDYSFNNSRRVHEDSRHTLSGRLENEYHENDEVQVTSNDYWSNYNQAVDRSKRAIEADDSRRVHGDSRLTLSGRLENEYHENDEVQVTSNDYWSNYNQAVDRSKRAIEADDSRRVHGDSRLTLSGRLENEYHENDEVQVTSNDYWSNYNQAVDRSKRAIEADGSRRVHEDSRHTLSGRLENEYHENDEVQITSNDYPGFWSNHNQGVDRSKQAIEADPLVIGSSSQSGRFYDPRDTETCNLSYPEYQGDTTITSTAPYDPHNPQIDFNGLSTVGANHNSVSANERVLSLGSYIMDASSSEPGQPFPQRVEQGGASNLSKTKFDWGDYVPLSNNPCEYSTQTNRNLVPYEIEGQRDMPLQSSFPDHQSPMEIGNAERRYEVPSYYYGNEYRLPEIETSKGLMKVYPDFTRGQIRDHESYPDFTRSQIWDQESYTECDTQKRRSSVFSRLALPPKENDIEKNSNSVDNSVDEVMLHRRYGVWMKQRNSNPVCKHSDSFVKPKMKKPSGFVPELLKDEMSKDVTEAFEEDGMQTDETLPLINFKRRSETRKYHDCSQNQGSGDNSETQVSPASQQKRRRLIRPRFIDNEPPKDIGSDDNIVDNTGNIVDNGPLKDKSSDDNVLESTGNIVDNEPLKDKGSDNNVAESTGNIVDNKPTKDKGLSDNIVENAKIPLSNADNEPNISSANSVPNRSKSCLKPDLSKLRVQCGNEDSNEEIGTVEHTKPDNPRLLKH